MQGRWVISSSSSNSSVQTGHGGIQSKLTLVTGIDSVSSDRAVVLHDVVVVIDDDGVEEFAVLEEEEDDKTKTRGNFSITDLDAGGTPLLSDVVGTRTASPME